MIQIPVTSIANLQIGQAQDAAAATGCTVILCPEGAAAGLDVRGGGPASRESELLRPVAAADRIHAVLLSGGSAFGLDAAAGVMRWLAEHDIGFDTGVAKVPLVCASCLYDLTVGESTVRPGPDMGYQALRKRRQLSGRLLRRGDRRVGGQIPRDGAGHENRHRQLRGPPGRTGSGGHRGGQRPGRRLRLAHRPPGGGDAGPRPQRLPLHRGGDVPKQQSGQKQIRGQTPPSAQ